MNNQDLLRNGDPAHGHQAQIGKTLKQSKPWWRPARSERAGPNIVFVLLDDLGFSDFGCYGGEIRTPNIDALAAGGLRYVQYTTVPMCTPARAALMTGKNPHSVGCGWLTHANPGYPGYQAGEISADAPTVPELLRQAGYATYGVGKWHNTPDYRVTPGGDRSSWPLQRGFDRYYGFLGAETNFFSPGHLIEGNEFVQIDEYPKDYYTTDDWTARAIRYLRDHASGDPAQPFYLYVAHNAPHVPLQARPEEIARYDGVYDGGWDAVREARFAQQKAMGLVPPQWRLGAGSPGVPSWESVPDAARPLMAYYMQIFAAMVEGIDSSVGALVAELKRLGQFDNTLFVITSDNGASSIGGPEGAANIFEKRVTKKEDPHLAAHMLAARTLGGVDSYAAYPVAWAQTSNTPFRFYKRTPMNGGIRVPFVLHWPERVRDGGALRHQWIHATDWLPTILELTGQTYPQQHRGWRTRKVDGVSFAATLANARAESLRDRQYYELEGNRGYRLGSWKAASLQPPGQPIDIERWTLFNLDNDPTECDNLAATHPDKLAELLTAFEQDAALNHVYPLDNRDNRRVLAMPPFLEDLYNRPRDFWPDTNTYTPIMVSPLLADRDYELFCEFDWQAGQQGTLFAIGDGFTGLTARVEGAEIHVVHRASPQLTHETRVALTPGAHTLRLVHSALGERKGLARINLDHGPALELDMSPTFLRIGGEGLDVGRDRRRRVLRTNGPDPTDAYQGQVHRVRIVPGPQAADSMVNRPEALAQLD